MELIFTNHDLLTNIMPFVNGGYYNYDRLLYKADQAEPTNIVRLSNDDIVNNKSSWFTLDGRRLSGMPRQCGIYINNGRKVVIR